MRVVALEGDVVDPDLWRSFSADGSAMKHTRECSLNTSLGSLSPKSCPVHFWFL